MASTIAEANSALDMDRVIFDPPSFE
jgi:hypothetical protein